MKARRAGELRKVDDGQSKVKGHKAVTLKDVGLTKQEVSSWKPFAVPEKELEKAITIVKQRDGVLTEAAWLFFNHDRFQTFFQLRHAFATGLRNRRNVVFFGDLCG